MWLRDKKSRRGKEVYRVDYETIKATVMSCGLIGAAHAAAASDGRIDAAALAPRVVGDENARPPSVA